MTGAYMRVQRDDKWENIEVEHLTDAELVEKFKDRPTEELLSWLQMLCGAIRHVEPLIRSLEEEGIIQRVSREEYEQAQQQENKQPSVGE